ncbi:ABC transporter substrate-binding protein [Bradyrhizobium manausense]|uniref:ABC transporter substrate-binding protein n=1 Tax=Bradyrhizobium manausense TaxID=989370 RepID=UPI001BA63B64|nr:ABC transporter substrate-binding protein [Bradyrhizobium manausense]MBR0690175.1 ABC transporter substrate-binding protein [Bradyrhizobium manausense]MBR0722703.1 ABC transporter substrate-binding protein [Bradyrhizobium manausense]MBR0832154.1 ABC transporter substrate-binding protein [Bradyrhizobium manausense]
MKHSLERMAGGHVVLAALLLVLGAWSSQGRAEQSKSTHELKIFKTPAAPAAKLLINGTADIASMGPVIEGFQKHHPDVEVDYRLYETVPLYENGTSQEPSADLLISSAMDLQVKLANDGHVQPASIIAARGLPDWAAWRDRVFGFTLEPAVIAYNADAVPPNDVPRSHRDLIRLLEQAPEKFRGKIATYDIGVSGVGYLFATTESMLSANFWRLTHALGTVKTQLFCCTQDMIDSVIRGDSVIAYDVLGSYALRRMEEHPNLKVVVPEDYVIVVARTIVIPSRAQHPDLAQTFIEYALSEAGQAIVADSFGLSVGGLGIDRDQMKARYVTEKPGLINAPPLGLSVLTYLDSIKREQFVRTWRQIVSP